MKFCIFALILGLMWSNYPQTAVSRSVAPLSSFNNVNINKRVMLNKEISKGKLLIISTVIKNNRKYFITKCIECGNEHTYRDDHYKKRINKCSVCDKDHYKKRKELTGKTFGDLTVKNFYNIGEDRQAQWLCECSCGGSKIVKTTELVRGRVVKCGNCFENRYGVSSNNLDEYKNYHSMKSRCYNTENKSYNRYGGRGIKVCDRWLNSFHAFYEDMGARPTKKHTIERIDNNGNYEPSNCKWATIQEQNWNRSTTNHYNVKGIKGNLKEICDYYEKDIKLVRSRLENGWNINKALNTKRYYTKNKVL